MHWLRVLPRSARRFLRSRIVMVFTAPYASRSLALKQVFRPYWGSISRLHHYCPSPRSDSALLRMAALGVVVLIRAQSCSPAGGKAGLRCVVQSALHMLSAAIPGYRLMMRLILTPAAS